LIEQRGAYFRLYEAQARRVDGGDAEGQGAEPVIAAQLQAAASTHAAVHSGVQP
jgi:hypothetical protein